VDEPSEVIVAALASHIEEKLARGERLCSVWHGTENCSECDRETGGNFAAWLTRMREKDNRQVS